MGSLPPLAHDVISSRIAFTRLHMFVKGFLKIITSYIGRELVLCSAFSHKSHLVLHDPCWFGYCALVLKLVLQSPPTGVFAIFLW